MSHCQSPRQAEASAADPILDAPIDDVHESQSTANPPQQAPPPSTRGASSESSGVSQRFLDALDLVGDELKLLQGVGARKIDVLIFKGYEFRCDRWSDRAKNVQRWCCRHAAKFKCKAKFKLHVPNLEDITDGSSVVDAIDHNHEPIQTDSFGLANISVLKDTSKDVNDAGPSTSSAHAISQLDENQFSFDFNEDNVNVQVHSSPIRIPAADIDVVRCTSPSWAHLPFPDHSGEQPPTTPTREEPAVPEVGATSIFVDTSQCDARGYRIKARRKLIPVGPDASHPSTSDV